MADDQISYTSNREGNQDDTDSQSEEDDTKLIVHQERLYKFKIIYDFPDAAKIDDLNLEMKEELWKVMRAVICMKELVPIRTKHFIVHITMKPWVATSALKFKRNTSELQANPNAFCLRISLNPGYLSLEQEKTAVCSNGQADEMKHLRDATKPKNSAASDNNCCLTSTAITKQQYVTQGTMTEGNKSLSSAKVILRKPPRKTTSSCIKSVNKTHRHSSQTLENLKTVKQSATVENVISTPPCDLCETQKYFLRSGSSVNTDERSENPRLKNVDKTSQEHWEKVRRKGNLTEPSNIRKCANANSKESSMSGASRLSVLVSRSLRKERRKHLKQAEYSLKKVFHMSSAIRSQQRHARYKLRDRKGKHLQSINDSRQQDRHLVEENEMDEECKLQQLARVNSSEVVLKKDAQSRKRRWISEAWDFVVTPLKRILRRDTAKMQ